MYYKAADGLNYFNGGSGENRIYVFDSGAYSTYSAKYLSLRDGSNNVDVQLNAEGSSWFAHRVASGTTSPVSDAAVTIDGTLTFKERANAHNDTADYGQVWVKSDTPNKLYFTDDAGTDHDLTAGGGGTIGGTVASGYIPVASATDTLANGVLFTSGATESMYIGATPGTLNAAHYNTTLGYQAGDDITEADECTLIGQGAGGNISTGGANTMI